MNEYYGIEDIGFVTDRPIKVEFDPEYKKKIDEIKKLIKRVGKMDQMEYADFPLIDEIEKIIGDKK